MISFHKIPISYNWFDLRIQPNFRFQNLFR